MVSAGLRHVLRGDSEYWIAMEVEQLTDYIMTHSGRLAAVQEGRETESEQRSYLRDGIAPFFESLATPQVCFGLGIDLYARR
jgi:hypothetical protein